MFLKKLYKVLIFESKEPKTFGFFHFVSATVITFLTTLLCKKCKDKSEHTERRVALFVWIGFALLEIYKQIVHSIELTDGNFVFEYSWSSFPFQLCSSPLYVLPFIAFLPSGKIREAFVAFFGTFTLLGGFAVCIYPGNVFVETLGINIQTMLCHGSQVALGVYFNLRRFYPEDSPKKEKYFLSAFPIFLISVFIATVLNFTVQGALNSAGIDEEFNMFFISPYFECMLPILSTVKNYVPFPIFLLAYIGGVSSLSYALLSAEVLCIKKNKQYIQKNRLKK